MVSFNKALLAFSMLSGASARLSTPAATAQAELSHRRLGFAEDTCREPEWVPHDNSQSPTGNVRCCAGQYGNKGDDWAKCDTSSCVNNFNGSDNRNCFNYGAPQNGNGNGANQGSSNCPYADSDHAICDTSYYDNLNPVACRTNPAGKNYQVHCLGKVKCNTVGVTIPKNDHSVGTADYDSSGITECLGAVDGFKAGDDCFYDGSSENWKVCDGGGVVPAPLPIPGGIVPVPAPLPIPGGIVPVPAPLPIPGGVVPVPHPLPIPGVIPAPAPLPIPGGVVPVPHPLPIPGVIPAPAPLPIPGGVVPVPHPLPIPGVIPAPAPLPIPGGIVPVPSGPPGSFGDPHVKKWGGDSFDFHGGCDLVLVDNPSFHDGLGMTIHIRTKIVTWWSHIATAVIRIGSDTLEITGGKSGKYYINGELGDNNAKDLTFAGFKVVTKEATNHQLKVRIDLLNADAVGFEVFKDFVRVNMKMTDPKWKKFEGSVGLMGAYPNGEALGRDGTTLFTDMNAFGKEWQVRENEPKLFRNAEGVQHPTECAMPEAVSSETKRRRLGEALITEEEAELACARVSGSDHDGRWR